MNKYITLHLQVRKSLVKILAVDAKGNPLANATVSLAQTGSGFPLGSELNHLILTNPGYAQWFTPRFLFIGELVADGVKIS